MFRSHKATIKQSLTDRTIIYLFVYFEQINEAYVITLISVCLGILLIFFFIFYAVSAVAKGNRRLVLPRISCYFFESNIDDKFAVMEQHNWFFLLITADY
jgi:hypothetical protein